MSVGEEVRTEQGQAAAEPRHGGRAESGHHDQVRAPDAGDQLPLAAADPALGGRPGRHVPGEPAADVRRGRRRMTFVKTGDRVGSSPRSSANCPRCGPTRTRRCSPSSPGAASSGRSRGRGDRLVRQPADEVYLLAHGRVEKVGRARTATTRSSESSPTARTSASRPCSTRTPSGSTRPARSPRAPCSSCPARTRAGRGARPRPCASTSAGCAHPRAAHQQVRREGDRPLRRPLRRAGHPAHLRRLRGPARVSTN